MYKHIHIHMYAYNIFMYCLCTVRGGSMLLVLVGSSSPRIYIKQKTNNPRKLAPDFKSILKRYFE